MESVGETVKRIRVVVGIIRNSAGDILIAKRSAHQYLAGYWEFPGGKLEPNEAEFTALKRELFEEIGIEVQQAHYLQAIEHDYADKAVELYVWVVTDFIGEAFGKESQEIRWVTPQALTQYSFPAANQEILQLLL